MRPNTGQRAFELFDIDRSGSISRDEFARILMRPNTGQRALSRAEADAAFDRFDTDRSDNIEFDEFVREWSKKTGQNAQLTEIVGREKVMRELCEGGRYLAYFPAERKVRFVEQPAVVLSYRWDEVANAHARQTQWDAVLDDLAQCGESGVADCAFTRQLEQLAAHGNVWVDQLCVPQGHGQQTMHLVKQCSKLYATIPVVFLTSEIKRLFNHGQILDEDALFQEARKLAEGFQRGWIIRETCPLARINKEDIDFFWSIYNHHVGKGGRIIRHLMVIIEVAKSMQGKSELSAIEQASTLYRISSAAFTVESDREMVMQMLKDAGKQVLCHRVDSPRLKKLLGAPLDANSAEDAFEEVKALVGGDPVRLHTILKTNDALCWTINDTYHGQEWWFPNEDCLQEDGEGCFDACYFLGKLVEEDTWRLVPIIHFGFGKQVKHHLIVDSKPGGGINFVSPGPPEQGPHPTPNHFQLECHKAYGTYLHAHKGELRVSPVTDTSRNAMWKEQDVGDGWFQLVMLHSGQASDPADELKLYVEGQNVAIGKVDAAPDHSLWRWSGDGAYKYLDAKSAPGLRLSRQPDGTTQAKVDTDWSAQWRKHRPSSL